MSINLAPGTRDIPSIVAAIRQLVAGRSNAVGSFSLAANAASTTVSAPNCATGSHVFLFPRTAHASAEIGNGTIFIAAADVANGSFKVTHANNAQTDRTFSFVALG